MSTLPLTDALFETPAHREFPVCVQVTLNHGICDSHCVSCPIGRLNHGDATNEVRSEFRAGRYPDGAILSKR